MEGKDFVTKTVEKIDQLAKLKDQMFDSEKKAKSKKATNDDGLTTLVWFMVFGLFAILLVCVQHQYWLMNLGLAASIGFASLLSGGFLGFLFGIPRANETQAQSRYHTTVISEDTSLSQKSDNETIASANTPSYGSNTNLEQISDWLTKIIVGVSLVEIHKIHSYFVQIVTKISAGFDWEDSSQMAIALTSSIIIFYSISGFLTVYLWARIYLLDQLNGNEKILREIAEKASSIVKTKTDQMGSDMEKQLSEQANKITQLNLENKIKSFNRQKNKIKDNENNPEIAELLKIAMPLPVTTFDDAQKNRWGGNSTFDNYQLKADVKEAEGGMDFEVKLEVKSIDETRPLTGKVYFFLHDTYPKSVEIIEAENNMASITLNSYEAFTVGAVFNEGKVKLELDMNLDPDVPSGYKYEEQLQTYEEIMTQLNALKKQNNE